MTPAQTQLAGRRLALGILNVGGWTLAAAGGLWFLQGPINPLVSPGNVALLLLGALGIQAGFDYVGGTLLMPVPRSALHRFLGSWLRGVAGHTLILGLIATLSCASFRLTGGFVAGVVAATLGLAAGRTGCLRLLGGVPLTSEPGGDGETLFATADDSAFTGTTVGWGGRAANLWSASWRQRVPADEWAAEQARRRWQLERGLPSRTVWLVLGWNAAGSALGTFLFVLSIYPPLTALLFHACWMTLWTFGSLLILPSLSRPAVFAADRAALDAGHDPRRWIKHFPELVGKDGGAKAFVQTIFYPIPSAGRRLQRLKEKPVAGFVAGNLARVNLYYSWAGCTPLGRTVHCNVGRPTLWIFPPSA